MPAPPAISMPAPTSNKALIGKKPSETKYATANVRDCLYWPEKPAPQSKAKTGKKTKGNKRNAETYRPLVPDDEPISYNPAPRYIPEKPEVGKAKSRGYAIGSPPPPKPKSDETAIRALRGWSDSFPPEDNEDGNNKDEVDPNIEEYNEFTLYKDDQGRTQTKPKGGNMSSAHKKKSGNTGGGKDGHKKSKGVLADYSDDHMGDILSFRFHNEEKQRRERLLEKQNAKKERAAEDAANAKAAMRNVKQNNASTARNNYITEKITPIDQELWKMSKFTKDAKPQVDTRRNKPFSHGKSEGANQEQSSHGICMHNNATDLYTNGYADLENDFTDVQLNSDSPKNYFAEDDRDMYGDGNTSADYRAVTFDEGE